MGIVATTGLDSRPDGAGVVPQVRRTRSSNAGEDRLFRHAVSAGLLSLNNG